MTKITQYEKSKDMEHLKLDNKYQRLSKLCLDYNPYEADISEEINNLLEEFDLDPKKEDPFSITNKLLRMLDQMETALKTKH